MKATRFISAILFASALCLSCKEDSGRYFQPVDYEQVVTRKHSKELSPKKVIEFLREQGVDANTIRIVEKQCSQVAVDQKAAISAADKQEQKKKQPKTITETTATEQKPAKRRGRPPKSAQTKAQPLDQTADATA